MRVLVTGCNGFIGHSICSSFHSAGHEVYGLGRASNPVFSGLQSYFQTDLCAGGLNRFLAQQPVDVVIHAAGAASVAGSYSSPVDDFRANVLSWMVLLDSIKNSCSGAKAVLLSSAAVYGNASSEPLDEAHATAPVSPYGHHKALAESISKEFSSCFGMDVLCFRLFSVFGERQRRLLLWDTFSKLRRNPAEQVFDGTGEEARDYLWVEDLARILSEVIPKMDCNGYTVMNIARGEATTVSQLVHYVKDALKVDTQIRFSGRERLGDPKKLAADISILKSMQTSHLVLPILSSIVECISKWQKT
jgi:UDP-glucose 4-epimerase